MSRLELHRILCRTFPETSVIPLLDDYDSMIRHLYLKKYDVVLVSGGRFVENLFICLSHMTDKLVERNSNLSEITKSLEQLPENTPSSIRIIIPRAARTLHDMQNKRNTADANLGVVPSYIDAVFGISIAKWILAELIRVNSDLTPHKTSMMMNGLVNRQIPLVEIIHDTPVILNPDLSARESIIILLYTVYPNPMNSDNIVKYLPNFTRPNIMTSLRNAEKARLVFREGDSSYLTSLGMHFVEENLSGLIK